MSFLKKVSLIESATLHEEKEKKAAALPEKLIKFADDLENEIADMNRPQYFGLQQAIKKVVTDLHNAADDITSGL